MLERKISRSIMEQLKTSLVPVVNHWRLVLAEELSCIEAGRATDEEKKMYKNHRAFLDCMQAYMQSGSIGDSLIEFLETSGDIGLTKHMLFRSRGNICGEERAKCVHALNRAISDRRQSYVCKKCVLVFESTAKPAACGRCCCSGISKAVR